MTSIRIMGIIIRQGFKSTVVSYVGVALGAFNLLYLFPKILTPEEIGLREILLGASVGLSFFAQLGTTTIMARFFPYFEDKDKQHNGFLLLMLLISALGFLLFSLAFSIFQQEIISIFAANSPLVNDYLFSFIPLTGLMMLQSILEAYARINLRIAIPTFIREIGLRLLLMGLVLIYGLGALSFEQFIDLFIATYAIAVCALLIYLRQLSALHLSWRYLKVGKPLAWEMMVYTSWLLIGGAGSIISDKIDGIMLASLSSLAAAGIYAVAFFIGTIIEMPKRSLGSIASPLVAKAWKDNDFNQLDVLYKKSALHQLLIGGWIFIAVWINIDLVFVLMPKGEVYSQGKLVVLLISAARLIDMASGIHGDIILSSRYYRFNLISILFLAVISFSSNYYMIPRYGLNGAAAGTLISLGCFIVLKMLFLQIKVQLHPFTKNWAKSAILIIVVLLASYWLPVIPGGPLAGIMSIIYRSLIVTLILSYGILRLRLSEEITTIYRDQLLTRVPIRLHKWLPQA